MAITTVDALITALAATSRQRFNFMKITTAAKAAGAYQSTWLNPGIPGAGAAPPNYNSGSDYTCSDATTGAPAFTNPATQGYLARAGFAASTACTVIIADRLWSCGNMGFAASTYAVTTPASLPARITDAGVGVEAYVEQFAAAGSASGTLTLTYVEPGGAGSHTGVIPAVVSAPVIGQMQPIPLQAGDTGIKQVTNAINSATWTSGSFGITLLKRLVEIPVTLAGTGQVLDYVQTALARVPSDCCFFVYIMASTTTATTITGLYDVIDA